MKWKAVISENGVKYIYVCIFYLKIHHPACIIPTDGHRPPSRIKKAWAVVSTVPTSAQCGWGNSDTSLDYLADIAGCLSMFFFTEEATVNFKFNFAHEFPIT